MAASHYRFTMKQGAMLIAAGCAVIALIATRPSSRLFFMGASQYQIKSGNWVDIGANGQMSDARFEAIVNAVNARGDVACIRISNPRLTDSAFVHVAKLTSLHWLYIEDAAISNASLDSIRPLMNLSQIHLDRCPNLSLSAIDQLRKDLPNCSIHVDSYTIGTSNTKTGSQNPDEQSDAPKSPNGAF